MKLKPFEKEITLSNGHRAVIRPLSVYDFALEGTIPDFEETEGKPVPGAPKPKENKKDQVRKLCLFLVRGVVRYLVPPGPDLLAPLEVPDPGNWESYTLTDKPPQAAGDDELPWTYLPDIIQMELVTEIRRASGVPDLAGFPGTSGPGAGGGDDGQGAGDDAQPDPGHEPPGV